MLEWVTAVQVFGIEFVPELAQVGKHNAMKATPDLFERGIVSITQGGALLSSLNPSAHTLRWL